MHHEMQTSLEKLMAGKMERTMGEKIHSKKTRGESNAQHERMKMTHEMM